MLLVLVAGSTVGVATGSTSTVVYGRAPAHASAPALRGQTWSTLTRRPHPRLARSSQSRLRALDAPFDEGMTDSGDDMPTVAGDYERADLSTAVDGSDDKASSTRAILPLSPLPTITAAALEPARIRDTVDFLSSARQWHAHPQSASALTTVRAMFHKIAMHGATVKHGHRRSSNDERSAMTASFRYLPRLPFVDAMRTVDALDYYLMLKRDNATIPFVVILRAEARLQRDVDRVQERIERAQRFRKDAAPDEPLPSFGRRRRTGNLVEELSTTLAFKRWV